MHCFQELGEHSGKQSRGP